MISDLKGLSFANKAEARCYIKACRNGTKLLGY